MIAIIDYGMGNLRSVEKALEYIGCTDILVTSDTKEICNADKIILPGVGAFRDAIETIKKKELDKAIYECINKNKPFLGICLGMQLLFEKSYENGVYDGLGILKGEIVRLPSTEIVPQIGWNNLDIKLEAPLFVGLPQKPYVYFVHSYYLETKEPIVSATTFYGKDIQIAVQKDNIFATQFHPEKSGDVGLKILKNFSEI